MIWKCFISFKKDSMLKRLQDENTGKYWDHLDYLELFKVPSIPLDFRNFIQFFSIHCILLSFSEFSDVPWILWYPWIFLNSFNSSELYESFEIHVNRLKFMYSVKSRIPIIQRNWKNSNNLRNSQELKELR